MDDRDFVDLHSGVNLVFIEDSKPKYMENEGWQAHLYYAFRDCCKCCFHVDSRN